MAVRPSRKLAEDIKGFPRRLEVTLDEHSLEAREMTAHLSHLFELAGAGSSHRLYLVAHS